MDTAAPEVRTLPPSPGPPDEEPSPSLTALRRLVASPLVMLIAVGIIAAIPRFMHLSHPNERIFDETYYAKDGCLYAGLPYKQCELETADEQSWVHPPLGKWMVAGGIKVFGYRPFGWRFSAAAVGTATVVLIALIGFLLFRSTLWGFVAGLLASVEGLLLVQSRVALLDIFLAFWVVVGFLFLVMDRRWIQRRQPQPSPLPTPPPQPPPRPEPPPPDDPMELPARSAQVEARDMRSAGGLDTATLPSADGETGTELAPGESDAGAEAETGTPPRLAPGRHRHAGPPPARVRVASPLWRPWLYACGVAFGLAGAVKWSAAPALLGAIGLYVGWEIARRRDVGLPVSAAAWRLVQAATGFLAGALFAALNKEPLAPFPLILIALVAIIVVVVEARVREGPDVRMTPGQLVVIAGNATIIGAAGYAVALGLMGRGSKVLALAIVMLMVVSMAAREWSRRRAGDEKSPLWATVQQEAAAVLLAFLILPMVAYLGTYVGEIREDDYPERRYYPGIGIAALQFSELFEIHRKTADFHQHLLAYDESKDDGKAHPYQSRPWEWIWLGRPIAYHYKTVNQGEPNEQRFEVLAVGNPAVFWGGMVAIPWLAVAGVRRRDWTAGFVLAALLSQWLFWFLPGISLQKVQFFFYATPIAPFLVLGVTYFLRDLARMRLAGSRSRPFLPLAVGWIVLAVALLMFFWPVLTAGPLSPDSWDARIWLRGPGWI